MITKLFTPMKVGNCTIPNRLVVPAMVTNYCDEDGFLTDRYMAYIEEKAKGGWGMIITEDYSVTPHGKGYQYIPGFYKDEHVALNKELTRRVHEHGSKIFCQMYHPGRQSSHAVNGNVQPLAPSGTKDPICMDLAREMTVEEIHTLVEDFGQAARRCKESGFDGIELHCAHGYLLAEFLSSYVNKRVDQYGGCFDNRVRIVDEIIAAMRKEVGDFPIQVRISANEYVQGGRTEAETYQLARHLEEVGFDAIHVSNGVYAAAPIDQIIAPMFTKHALNMEAAANVKKVVKIPVILANRINEPGMADILLEMDKCDFVGMARGSLADPYLPVKAKEGKFDQINYCIGCLQGCEGPLLTGGCVTCLVNPRVGREYETDLTKTTQPKKVMVIGGGPAGLVAARTAAIKGHDVSLYEASSHLGGQFRSAAYPIGKGELSTTTSSYRANLEALNVPVHLNSEVSEEMIQEIKPDAIILATGAKPMVPPIKGIDGKNVFTAEDMLLGKYDISNGPIVVCGGGEVGGETAHYLAEKNHDVTLLEMQPDILNDMMIMTKVCLLEMIQKAGIKVKTQFKVKEITETAVIGEDASGNSVSIPAVQVISAFGYKSYNPLEEIAKKYTDETGVEVKVVTAASGKYEQTLKSEITKSDAPTLFQINGPIGYQSWKDYCADLTDTELNKHLLNQDLAIKGDDDKVYGIPYVEEGYGIIYNQSIMDKYFALDGAKVKSMDEINSFAKLKEVAEDMQSKKDELGIKGVFASTSLTPGEDWRWQTHLANLPIYYEYKDNNVKDEDKISFKYSDNYKNIFDLYINYRIK